MRATALLPALLLLLLLLQVAWPFWFASLDFGEVCARMRMHPLKDSR
jgi:hypothetical protein